MRCWLAASSTRRPSCAWWPRGLIEPARAPGALALRVGGQRSQNLLPIDGRRRLAGLAFFRCRDRWRLAWPGLAWVDGKRRPLPRVDRITGLTPAAAPAPAAPCPGARP